MKKIFFFVFCLIKVSNAQLSDQNYLIEYKKAVQLFANSQFEAASQKFSVLCTKSYNNPVVPYAYFYNALSSKNKGNLYQSRIIFRQLFDSYYDWEKIDEARLIYADINFRESYYEEALKNLDIIQNPDYNVIKNEMLETYIPKVKSISGLKELYFKFPTQKIIAKRLIAVIQENRFNSKEDLEISDLLTNRFKFDTEISTENDGVDKKNKYNISDKKDINFAVLLPFQLTEIQTGSTQNTNRYTFDMYAGMKLAVQKLKTEGVTLNIFAFDIQKSKEDFEKFERKDNFNSMDVFLGPLYPEPNESASDFANIHKVIQVHPLSNNVNLLKENRSIFLVQPSYTLQSRKSLDFMVDKNAPKSVSIFFGPSKKDSLFAYIYRVEAIKKGFKVNKIQSFLGGYMKITPESGHVFFAGDNNLGAKFITNLNRNKINSDVIISAASMNWDMIQYSTITDNIHFVYPEFINKTKDAVVTFDSDYMVTNSTSPSFFSYWGYDIALYFGRMLKEGKSIFKLNIEAGPYTDDYLLSGFDFSGKKYQNEIVPIVKYNGAYLEEVFR